jgi:uncharacterized protein (DUF433 family)
MDVERLMQNPVTIHPHILGGTPCFTGTRVPVVSLFEALAHGRPVEYFLEQFPTVTLEHVRLVLDQAQHLIIDQAHRTQAA